MPKHGVRASCQPRLLEGRYDAGTSLVELLVAIFIFGLIAAAVGANLTRGLDLTRTNRQRSVAANLAAQELDVVRNTPPTSVTLGLVTSTQAVDSTMYTVRRTSQWVTKNATAGACDGGSGTRQAYLRISVNVTWSRMSGIDPVTSDTLIFPKVGSFSPNTGAIAVKVRNRGAAPQSDVLVTLAGPGGTFTQTTGDDGCAYFAFLVPGTYAASLARPNFVDLVGQLNPSVQVGAVIGTTSATSFDFDQKAQLFFLVQGPDSSHPPPSAVPVRLGNSNGAFPYGVTGAYPGAGSTATAQPLFPFASGYTAWAGDCADADPGVSNRGTAFATDPGTVGGGIIKLGGIDVTAKSATTGNALSGVAVVAAHPADTVPQGCSATRTYTLPGTTDSSGNLRASLPFGTWRLAVSGKAVSATVTLTRGAGNATATVTG